MTDRQLPVALGVLAVAMVAIALRAGPLHVSPLPFNPDGIIHARHAALTITQEQLPLAGLGTDDVVFVSFLAVVATVAGEQPLYVAQPAIAVVGMIPCLLAFGYARRIGRALGWPSRQAAAGGLMAGGLLAVEGVYLHRSMATDEQTLGLLFVPLLVVTVVRALITGSRRWYAIAGPVLVVLPATHNLDTLVAAMALTAIAALVGLYREQLSVANVLGVACAGWVVLLGYTYGSAWLTPLQILQSERITSVPGLFLGWLVVLVALYPWFIGASRRTQRTLGVGTFGVILGLATIHAIVPIVPGTRPTPPLLLAGVFPLFLITVIGAWVTPSVLRTWTGAALAAMFGVAVVLILFAFSASLTPDYFNLAYRAQTFLHFPAMTVTGLGVVAALRTRPRLDRRHAAVAVAVVLVAAAMSIPIAFSGLSLLSYKGITTPAEYESAQFADDYVPGAWAADNHIARITWALEDRERATGTRATTTPVRKWTGGGVPPPACPTVIQQSWTIVGAQLFPAPPGTVPAPALDRFRTTKHAVYDAGTTDPLWLIIPTQDASQCS